MDDKSNPQKKQKNVVNAPINAQGNVHIGDVTHHHETSRETPSEKPKDPELLAKARQSIRLGQPEAAFEALLAYCEEEQSPLLNEVFLLSGQFHDLQRKIRTGIISDQQADQSRNRILNSLLQLVNALGKS